VERSRRLLLGLYEIQNRYVLYCAFWFDGHVLDYDMYREILDHQCDLTDHFTICVFCTSDTFCLLPERELEFFLEFFLIICAIYLLLKFMNT